jgi:predicted ATPase
VSIVGIGGVGKSRLAAELIARWSRTEDIVAVSLAPASPVDVLPTLGAALGVRGERVDARVIVDLLRSASVVIVLDNAEHVLDAVRGFVRPLLDGCPDVRILTTTRRRLELPDEVVVPVEPLSTEGDDAEAVALFTDRLRRARHATKSNQTTRQFANCAPGSAACHSRSSSLQVALHRSASRCSTSDSTRSPPN